MHSRETAFRLKDKTVILAGPVSSVTKGIAAVLTEHGADVALVAKDIEGVRRYVDNLTDTRQVNESFGRAMALSADLTDASAVSDAVSRVAESLGGLDVCVDTHYTMSYASFNTEDSIKNLDQLLDQSITPTLLTTHASLKFLEGRQKGRLIYLMQDAVRSGLAGESLNGATRSGLVHFAKSVAREVIDKNITVNCVSMGITEEYLLSRFPQAATIKEAQQEMQKTAPQARIVDPIEIANVVAFLASPLSSAITGQTIVANSGLSF